MPFTIKETRKMISSSKEISEKNRERILQLHKIREALFGPNDVEKSNFVKWAGFDEELTIKVAEFFYDGMYKRQKLTQRERELCAIAALTATRAEKQLRTHIRAARNVGASQEEIGEVIFQMIAYAGMPAFVNAMDIAYDIFCAEDAENG
tara:strand:- start:2851 stop:3300 length:450 start_codon:yes stop_codon:yes gene_type:complete